MSSQRRTVGIAIRKDRRRWLGHFKCKDDIEYIEHCTEMLELGKWDNKGRNVWIVLKRT